MFPSPRTRGAHTAGWAFAGLVLLARGGAPTRGEQAFSSGSEQVRQPIFRTSLPQWRHYEPWLGTLKEALGMRWPAIVNSVGELAGCVTRRRHSPTRVAQDVAGD